jgi:hypothetical protein
VHAATTFFLSFFLSAHLLLLLLPPGKAPGRISLSFSAALLICRLLRAPQKKPKTFSRHTQVVGERERGFHFLGLLSKFWAWWQFAEGGNYASDATLI